MKTNPFQCLSRFLNLSIALPERGCKLAANCEYEYDFQCGNRRWIINILFAFTFAKTFSLSKNNSYKMPHKCKQEYGITEIFSWWRRTRRKDIKHIFYSL